MKQFFFILIIALSVLSSCSSGKKALLRGDYYVAISKALERLQSDPDNRKATSVLKEGYPLAIKYYQEEIDLLLTDGNRFKWRETVKIMERINDLSEQIRRIPAARKLIPNPKTYKSEMRPAKEKAAEELYNAGLERMETGNKEDAREAYYYFLDADRLIPSYENVNKLLRESKEMATYKVIVEQIPIFSELYALSTAFFYDRLMGMLKYNFPDKHFVNFYSENEAGNLKIEYPDMILKMRIYDFYIGRIHHNETEEPLSRVIEKQVKVTRGDSVYYETKLYDYKGTLKIINDQVFTEGVLKVEIFDFQKNDKILLTENYPGQFVWNNSYGVFVGDREVLNADHLALLKNKAYSPPSPQELLIEFSKPVFDQLTSRLKGFFRKYD